MGMQAYVNNRGFRVAMFSNVNKGYVNNLKYDCWLFLWVHNVNSERGNADYRGGISLKKGFIVKGLGTIFLWDYVSIVPEANWIQ